MTAGAFAAAFDGPGGDDIASSIARHVEPASIDALGVTCRRVGDGVYVGGVAQYSVEVWRRDERPARERWAVAMRDTREGPRPADFIGVGASIEQAAARCEADVTDRHQHTTDARDALRWAKQSGRAL